MMIWRRLDGYFILAWMWKIQISQFNEFKEENSDTLTSLQTNIPFCLYSSSTFFHEYSVFKVFPSHPFVIISNRQHRLKLFFSVISYYKLHCHQFLLLKIPNSFSSIELIYLEMEMKFSPFLSKLLVWQLLGWNKIILEILILTVCHSWRGDQTAIIA